MPRKKLTTMAATAVGSGQVGHDILDQVDYVVMNGRKLYTEGAFKRATAGGSRVQAGSGIGATNASAANIGSSAGTTQASAGTVARKRPGRKPQAKPQLQA